MNFFGDFMYFNILVRHVASCLYMSLRVRGDHMADFGKWLAVVTVDWVRHTRTVYQVGP